MDPENQPLEKEIPNLETIIFRFHVKFWGCNHLIPHLHAIRWLAGFLRIVAGSPVQAWHSRRPAFGGGRLPQRGRDGGTLKRPWVVGTVV